MGCHEKFCIIRRPDGQKHYYGVVIRKLLYNGITLLRGDWRNHAREATSPLVARVWRAADKRKNRSMTLFRALVWIQGTMLNGGGVQISPRNRTILCKLPVRSSKLTTQIRMRVKADANTKVGIVILFA